MTERRFLIWFFGTAVVGAAVTALLAILVDPYLVFDRPRLTGLNHIKPAVGTNEPMMKAYQATRAIAQTVILGSSRAGVGLDPEAPEWPPSMQPVYNLAIVGSALDEQLQYLQLLLSAAPKVPTVAVVGLDFEAFLSHQETSAAPPPRKPDSQQARLSDLALRKGEGGWTVPKTVLLDMAVASLTLDALLDTGSTVAASLSGQGIDVKPNGHSSEWQFQTWTRLEGPAKLFEQKRNLVFRQYRNPRQVLGKTPSGPIEGLAAVRDLLTLTSQRNIKLILAVQPSHISHHELLDGLGYWDDLERWKRALTQLVAERRAGGQDVRLFDFAGYEAEFSEPVPPGKGPSVRMQGFWDPVHYSAALGRKLIAVLTGSVHDGTLGAVELTPDKLEGRLARVREDRRSYREANPQAWRNTELQLCGAPTCVAARSVN